MKIIVALLAGVALGFALKQNRVVHVTMHQPVTGTLISEKDLMGSILRATDSARKRGIPIH